LALARASKLLRNHTAQKLVFLPDNSLPVCVLGEGRGVQRDLHQELGNPLSRLTPSHVVKDLRNAINRRIDELGLTTVLTTVLRKN
jgi:hypothetical protein